jgi:hypothetical protein
MKLPAEAIPLNRWCAYKAPLPENSPKSRTIIIVHRTETDIKYFYVTSQVDKAKRRCRDDKDALVEIERSEWSEVLRKEKSCIQCGKRHLKCIDIKKFKNLYDKHKISAAIKIPELIIQKVKKAINASITYTYIEQSILTNEK